jgi:hypothetical protein
MFQMVNLAGNNIRSLAGLEDHPLLENVDLEDNEVGVLGGGRAGTTD